MSMPTLMLTLVLMLKQWILQGIMVPDSNIRAHKLMLKLKLTVRLDRDTLPPSAGTYSSIISRTVVETVSREPSFQMSSGFSCVPSKMCTAASALSRMASMNTPGRKRISVRRTCRTAGRHQQVKHCPRPTLYHLGSFCQLFTRPSCL